MKCFKREDRPRLARAGGTILLLTREGVLVSLVPRRYCYRYDDRVSHDDGVLHLVVRGAASIKLVAVPRDLPGALTLGPLLLEPADDVAVSIAQHGGQIFSFDPCSKQEGAATYHEAMLTYGYPHVLLTVARKVLQHANLLFGVASGAAIFTAQFWGQRDITRIRSVLGICLFLLLGKFHFHREQ